MLQGTYAHSVDQKGRVVLPVKLKEGLGEEFKICRGDKKGCLLLYSITEWEIFCQKIDALPFTKKSTMARFYMTSAYDVSLDSQGRILIPQQLRNMIGLGEEAVITGAGGRAELWEPGEFETYQSTLTYELIEQIMDESGI